MDNKVMAGLGVLFVVFLAFPFVAQNLKGDASDTAESADTATSTGTSVTTMSSEPPLWNSTNIVGTEWEVEWEGNMLKMTVEANGVCYVTHPLMKQIAGTEYVEGRWRCEYDKAYIDVAFGTKEYNLEMKIVGDQIIEPRGTPAKRIK